MAGAVILAGNAILGTGDTIPSELAAVVGDGRSIAFLWQAAVAGHHALGEPLRCVVVGPAETVRDDRDRARRARRARVRAGRLDRRPRRAGRPLVHPRAVPRHARRPGAGRLRRRRRRVRDRRAHAAGRRCTAGCSSCCTSTCRVMEFPPFFERTFGRVPLEGLTPTWFLHTMHLHRRDEESVSKRTLDLVAGDGRAGPRLAADRRRRDRRAAARRARAGDLPADADRRARPALHDAEVPLDAQRRRERRHDVDRRRRPAHHRRRRGSCGGSGSTSCRSS